MAFSLTEHVRQINYTVQGAGPPVILVHGIAASLYDWENLMPELARAGHGAYALDLLGHGESAKPENHQHYHFRSLFAHLAAWIDTLELEQPPVLVGHSLGGGLCLKYALEYPAAVQGLVLIAPFFSLAQLSPLVRLANRRPHLGEKAIRMAPQWLIYALLGWDIRSVHFPRRARRRNVEDFKRASPKFPHIVDSLPDLVAGLPTIASPALVIWGEKDLTLDPKSFPPLVERLPAAVGQPIPGSGHQPHLAKPGQVNRLILEFLASHSP